MRSTILDPEERYTRILDQVLAIGQTAQQHITEDPKKVYELIAEAVCKTTEADCAVLYPYHPAFGEFYDLVNVAAYGLRHELQVETRVDKRKGLTARIHTKGEIICENIEDIEWEETHPYGDTPLIVQEEIKAFMGLSLALGENVLGILYVDYRSPHQFSEDEKQIIRLFGQQAALAVSNSWTSRLAAIRADTVARLKTIGQSLVAIEDPSKTLDSVLEGIAHSAQEVLDADLVDLYQYIQTRNEFVLPPALVGDRWHPHVPKDKIYDDDVVMRVVKIGEPQYFHDAQGTSLLIGKFEVLRDDAPDERFVVREGVAASAMIPLMAGGETVGVMFVNYRSPQLFGSEQRDVIESLAAQAAVAIRNARLFQLEEQQRQQSETLRKVAQIVNSTLERDEVVALVLDQLREVIEYDSASVQLIQGNHRILIGGRGFLPGDSPRELLRDVYQDPLVSKIVHERRPLVLGDVKDEPLWDDMPETAHINSWIGVPLIVRDQVIGLMTLDHEKAGYYTQEAGDVVAAFANQVALAIHNSELFSLEQRRRRALAELLNDFQILHEVANDLAKQPALEQIYQLAVESALRTLRCSHSTIFMLDKKVGELVAVARVGAPQSVSQVRHFRLGEGLAGAVLESGQSIRVNNAAKDEHFIEGEVKPRSAPRSIVLAPIKIEDEVIGVISADKDETDGFTEHNLRVLEMLALDVGATINVRQQLQQLSDQARALAELNELAPRLISIEEALQDSRNLLEQVATSAQEVLGADLIDLYEYLQERNEYQLPQISVGERRGPQVLKDRIHEDDSVFQLINREEPLYVESAQVHHVLSGPYSIEREGRPTDRFVAREGIQSTAAIPLRTGSETVGLMFASYRMPQSFTKEQKEIIELFANQAAIVIHYCRLFNALDRRVEALSALNEVGQTLTSGIRLVEDEILELIYEQAHRLTYAQDMYIALYDDATEMIRFGLALERGQRVTYESRQADMGRRGRTEEAIFTRQPLLHRTLQDAKDWYDLPGHQEFIGDISLSWLGVPMMVGEKVLGVIAIYDWEQEQAYDELDLQVLASMASQAAIAIDNADLHYEVNQALERRVEVLGALNEVGETLTSGIRLQEYEILELIYEQARRLTDAQDMYIALYDDATQMIRFGLAIEGGRRVEIAEPRKADMEKRGKSEEIIFTRQPILHTTQKEALDWYSLPGHQEFIGHVSSSWLGVPMMVGEKVLGVISLQDWEQEQVYDELDLQVLASVANSAAIAIDSARLFESTRQIARQRQQRLELLQQISERMAEASLDPDEVLELVADGANDVTSSDLTSIYRYDQEASNFTRGVQVSPGRGVEQITSDDLPDPDEVPARIAQTQEAVFVEDVGKSTEEFAFARRHRLKAVAGLPLTIVGPQGMPATVGVLFLNFKEPHTFSEDEQEILRHLANQAAVAIAYAGAQESAQAKEQLAALGTAAATLQHRLGNTINVILPAVMRLRYRVGDDPDNMEILDTIERNALFATEVIRRMQTPLRQEPFILTNINGLLRDAIQKCIQDTDRFPDILLTSNVPGLTRDGLELAVPPQGQITITTDLDDSLPETHASSGQMTEVFRVLVENAIKAIYPHSGSVTIFSKFEDDHLRPCVEVTVSDTGKGIDEKTRSRLFHQPVPRKEFGEGAGLGLWLSSIIVRSHQGSIELQSTELNKGSTFLVRLPVLRQAPPSPTSQRGEIS